LSRTMMITSRRESSSTSFLPSLLALLPCCPVSLLIYSAVHLPQVVVRIRPPLKREVQVVLRSLAPSNILSWRLASHLLQPLPPSLISDLLCLSWCS
jgi:hypothetical protein